MTDETKQTGIVDLRDGLCLVTLTNVGGGATALHSNPICALAARNMKAAIDAQNLDSSILSASLNNFASEYEMRARIVEALEPTHPDVAESVAVELEKSQPWRLVHTDDGLPF